MSWVEELSLAYGWATYSILTRWCLPEVKHNFIDNFLYLKNLKAEYNSIDENNGQVVFELRNDDKFNEIDSTKAFVLINNLIKNSLNYFLKLSEGKWFEYINIKNMYSFLLINSFEFKDNQIIMKFIKRKNYTMDKSFQFDPYWCPIYLKQHLDNIFLEQRNKVIKDEEEYIKTCDKSLKKLDTFFLKQEYKRRDYFIQGNKTSTFFEESKVSNFLSMIKMYGIKI